VHSTGNTVDFAGNMDDQALAWVARLRSDVAGEQDHQGFALWLAANPEHGQAMDRMLELWDDLAVVEHLPLVAPQPASTQRRYWLGAGLAVAASLLLAVFLTPQLNFTIAPQHYRTQLGEQLVIELSDGSRVTLNTSSRLKVQLNNQQRRLVLSQGEAFFEVAKDSRPFVVEAGTAEVRALGTAFNIYVHGEQSDITVSEGVVRVTDRHNSAPHAPQHELLYAEHGISSSAQGLSAPATTNSSFALAWREGKIIADGMTVARLAAQLERYHDKQILLGSTEISQLSVSGVFQLNSPDATLHAVGHSLGLRVVPIDAQTVQLIK
jgi:transmembrane sensor